MSNGNDFEDKAARLMNKLTAVPSGNIQVKTRIQSGKTSLQEISRLKEELEYSEGESRKKMKGLNENLRKLEGTLADEGQLRVQKDENFSQTVTKLQKNMKVALSNVEKGFSDREKKLQEKLDLLIRNERKQLQSRVRDNEQLIQQMESLQTKITTIVDEIVTLRRTRVELEERINKQFAEQLRELKKIFEVDIRAREEREVRVVQALKAVYKNGMERVYTEEKEREDGQKMLMTVIEQLVDHIIEV